MSVLASIPVCAVSTTRYLAAALEIAVKYDRSVYDALFVALAEQRGVRAVTADEPLFNVTHHDIPQIMLLRTF